LTVTAEPGITGTAETAVVVGTSGIGITVIHAKGALIEVVALEAVSVETRLA